MSTSRPPSQAHAPMVRRLQCAAPSRPRGSGPQGVVVDDGAEAVIDLVILGLDVCIGVRIGIGVRVRIGIAVGV